MGTTTITEERNVRVTGSVSVTGGAATVEAKVTLTPTAGTVPIELIALSLQSVSPVDLTPFSVDIPFSIVPGENGGGTVRVDVTGTDERGGIVDIFEELTATPDNTRRPPTSCVEDPETMCLLDGNRFRVDVDWRDFDGNTGQGVVTLGERFEDGGWFSFAALAGLVNPDGFDLFLQMTDGCSDNNNFWTFVAGATDVEYTLRVDRHRDEHD